MSFISVRVRLMYQSYPLVLKSTAAFMDFNVQYVVKNASE